MAAGSKKTFEVVTALGTTVEVTATRAEETDTKVTFYDGDEPVGSFRGYSSYHIKG